MTQDQTGLKFILIPPAEDRLALSGQPNAPKQGLAHQSLQAESGPLPVFINKVLLEHICLDTVSGS